jgi:hypothetical protein
MPAARISLDTCPSSGFWLHPRMMPATCPAAPLDPEHGIGDTRLEQRPTRAARRGFADVCRRIQGKSCFSFARIDEPLFGELARLTEVGIEGQLPVASKVQGLGTLQ